MCTVSVFNKRVALFGVHTDTGEGAPLPFEVPLALPAPLPFATLGVTGLASAASLAAAESRAAVRAIRSIRLSRASMSVAMPRGAAKRKNSSIVTWARLGVRVGVRS